MSVAALEWIARGDDVGLSSRAIWAHMMGTTPRRMWGEVDYPHDPGDFSRCFNLLRRVPEWRPRIGEMARYGGVWARFAPAWNELEALYLAEVGAAWPPPRVMANRLYERMQRLVGVSQGTEDET